MVHECHISRIVPTPLHPRFINIPVNDYEYWRFYHQNSIFTQNTGYGHPDITKSSIKSSQTTCQRVLTHLDTSNLLLLQGARVEAQQSEITRGTQTTYSQATTTTSAMLKRSSQAPQWIFCNISVHYQPLAKISQLTQRCLRTCARHTELLIPIEFFLIPIEIFLIPIENILIPIEIYVEREKPTMLTFWRAQLTHSRRQAPPSRRQMTCRRYLAANPHQGIILAVSIYLYWHPSFSVKKQPKNFATPEPSPAAAKHRQVDARWRADATVIFNEVKLKITSFDVFGESFFIFSSVRLFSFRAQERYHK